MNWQIALVAALAMVAAPMAGAATLTVDVDDAVVNAGGMYEIPYTYSETCANGAPSMADILTGLGSVESTITATGGIGVSFTDSTATLDYSSCVSGPAVDPSTTGTLTVTADEWAPGMVPQSVTLSDGTATDSFDLTVNYTNAYAVSVDASFPMETKNGKASFNMTLTVTANAPSMIMFFVNDPACGTIKGVPEFLNINEGDYTVGEPMKIVQAVSYENTCSDNDMDYFEFSTVAHNVAFSTEAFSSYTQNWTFQNSGGSTAGEGGSKDSPAPGLFLVLAGLAVVAIARRK